MSSLDSPFQTLIWCTPKRDLPEGEKGRTCEMVSTRLVSQKANMSRKHPTL